MSRLKTSISPFRQWMSAEAINGPLREQNAELKKALALAQQQARDAEARADAAERRLGVIDAMLKP
jgi:hypothetical protein